MFKKFALLTVVLMVMFAVAGVAMAKECATETAAAPVVAVEKVVPISATTEAVVPVVVGNTICPVTGNTIAKADMGKNTVEFEGKVYNLCCPACPDTFNKDPKMYVAKVEAEMAKEAAAAVTK